MNRATDLQVSFINDDAIATSLPLEEGASTRTITKNDIYTDVPLNNPIYVYEVTYQGVKEVLDYMIESADSMALRMSGVTAYYQDQSLQTILLGNEVIFQDGIWMRNEITPIRTATIQYIGTSKGISFSYWTQVHTNYADTESYITVLIKEAEENEHLLHVSKDPNMICGEYQEPISLLSLQLFSLPRETQTGEFVLLTTTDMHGKCWSENIFNDTSVDNSMLKVASVVKEIRSQYGDNLILIDNGDLFQGTPISSYNLQNGGEKNPMQKNEPRIILSTDHNVDLTFDSTSSVEYLYDTVGITIEEIDHVNLLTVSRFTVRNNNLSTNPVDKITVSALSSNTTGEQTLTIKADVEINAGTYALFFDNTYLGDIDITKTDTYSEVTTTPTPEPKQQHLTLTQNQQLHQIQC